MKRRVLQRTKNRGVRALSRETGLSPATISRALRGRGSAETLERLEKVASRLRTKADVSTTPATAPRRQQEVTDWSLDRIRSARDAQMRGDFKEPVRLAEMMKTDDATFVAYHNRIAPQFALTADLVAAPGTRGDATCRRARVSCIVQKSVLATIHGTLADHGIAIGYIEQEPNDEGTRIDFRLTSWPLEHVRYNISTEVLETRTRDGGAMVPIVHGDGRWIIFRKFNVQPWKQEACILPGSMIWGYHAFGLQDWAASARSHGRAKVMGELPEGVSLDDDDGNLTPEAASFLRVLAAVVEGESGAGIRPAGSKTDFVANSSSMWQVFPELIGNREKAAARVYLGTDAILGSVGGAPGIDIAQLFKIAGTKLQGDLQAIQEGLFSGFYVPWCALNEGDSRNAPTLVYQVPDPDSEQNIEQIDKRRTAFFDALERYRKAGMTLDQAVVNCLATEYKIEPPTLAPAAQQAVKLDIAPTDVAKVFTIDEIRASQGGARTGTPRGAMTIPQADAADKAAADAAVKAAPVAPAPPAPPAPGGA